MNTLSIRKKWIFLKHTFPAVKESKASRRRLIKKQNTLLFQGVLLKGVFFVRYLSQALARKITSQANQALTTQHVFQEPVLPKRYISGSYP
jgi:hypothetical protein